MKFLEVMRNLSPEDLVVIKIGYLLLSDLSLPGLKITDDVEMHDYGSKRIYTFEVRSHGTLELPVQALRARLTFLTSLPPYSLYSVFLYVGRYTVLYDCPVNKCYISLISDAA